VRRDRAELAKVLVDFAAGAGAGQQVEEGGVDGRVPAILGCCVQATRGGASHEGSREGSRSLRCEDAVRRSCSHTASSYNALHGDCRSQEAIATRALGDFDPTRIDTVTKLWSREETCEGRERLKV
jgi:hypothetical protein